MHPLTPAGQAEKTLVFSLKLGKQKSPYQQGIICYLTKVVLDGSTLGCSTAIVLGCRLPFLRCGLDSQASETVLRR
jgi:hypothetical protein